MPENAKMVALENISDKQTIKGFDAAFLADKQYLRKSYASSIWVLLCADFLVPREKCQDTSQLLFMF